MTYEYLKNLKATNPTLKLLNSDNFAMTLSFFYTVFIQGRETSVVQSKMVQYLDDYLFALRAEDEELFPREPNAYLEDFTQSGFLRKYYADAEEPLYELTPHTQKALEWIEGLQKREFVGSRSKFNLIFELLEELEFETRMDDEERIAKLEAEKERIDRQIEAIRSKQDLRFDESRIKEHYMQIEEIARKLKYDFSQIEYNFRELNTTAMEQIATREDAKGEVLGSIFEIEERIRQSDQGKSFFAFWQLLTDSERNEKLSQMIQGIYEIPAVARFDEAKKLKHLKYDLLERGEKISEVTSRLIEQLRRFIDDRVWVENRRILQLCRSIEKQAMECRDLQPRDRSFISIAGERVEISSIASKSLYRVKKRGSFKQKLEEKMPEVDLESFYLQCYVDEQELRRNVDALLQREGQCTLGEIVEKYPVSKGVSELVGYLSIARGSENAWVDDAHKEKLRIEDLDGTPKCVIAPKIIFMRKSE